MIGLSNVINISVSQSGGGLGEYNINNLALFVDEAFLSNPDSDVFRAYKSASAVLTDFGSGTDAYNLAVMIFAQQPNILAAGGELIIIPQSGSETLAAAIERTKDLVFYCGILSNFNPTGSDRTTLAATIQAYDDKIWFLPSHTYADVAGDFTDIKDAGSSRTRCLLYTLGADEALEFAAAYASRALSVDFDGSNTAITMNLKQLVGVLEDTGITQTYYTAAQTAGVDLYVSYAGDERVTSFGANEFFDDVFNLIWFVSKSKIVGFNTLASVNTKIPQTEAGMSLIKSAFRKVCEQAVKNGYVAPGTWNAAEWFGNQEDMINNIAEKGYYIYSSPVSAQTQAVRETRVAPTIQIAIKLAGACHVINVAVTTEA